jgi:D-amino peptidase
MILGEKKMKIYISADIEGVTDVTHWNETDLDKSDSQPAREQMTAEVVAACEGAIEAGAGEIWIKDAHDTARNIIPERLPRLARLIRGWSGHPFTMLQELDSSFDALILVGYHTGAAFGGNPLAHTMSGNISWIKINGSLATEFLISAYTAALVKVPLVFVSGDSSLCAHVTAFNPNITTVSVKDGVGDSSINLHPGLAVERIHLGVFQALQNPAACMIPLPERFSVEIQYRHPHHAYHYSFLHGAALMDPVTVGFEHEDYFEVLRFLLFALG